MKFYSQSFVWLRNLSVKELLGFMIMERKTGLEPATPTLAR